MRDLIEAIVSAFGYGVSPYVLTYEMADLEARVDKSKGQRRKTWPNHVHPVSVHPIWPGEARVSVQDNDSILAIVHGGASFEGRSKDASGRPSRATCKK